MNFELRTQVVKFLILAPRIQARQSSWSIYIADGWT